MCVLFLLALNTFIAVDLTKNIHIHQQKHQNRDNKLKQNNILNNARSHRKIFIQINFIGTTIATKMTPLQYATWPINNFRKICSTKCFMKTLGYLNKTNETKNMCIVSDIVHFIVN